MKPYTPEGTKEEALREQATQRGHPPHRTTPGRTTPGRTIHLTVPEGDYLQHLARILQAHYVRPPRVHLTDDGGLGLDFTCLAPNDVDSEKSYYDYDLPLMIKDLEGQLSGKRCYLAHFGRVFDLSWKEPR